MYLGAAMRDHPRAFFLLHATFARLRPFARRFGRPFAHRFALPFALLFALLLAGRAMAAGIFTVKTPAVDEKSGEWHIKVRIDLPRAPGMMHTPMRFTFSKEAVDERAIMAKGAEPVHHRMVIDTPPKQVVSMDVDFADPTGKVFKSTYFEFDLQRANGYFEAGEYLVSLAGPDGDVGGAQRITLKGDNPPVYRGAMDFTENKATKRRGPKIENVSTGLDAGERQVAENESPVAGPMATDVAPVGSAPTMVPSNAYNRTAEEEAVQDHPKGCGCKAAGVDRASGGAALAAMVVLGFVVARRRRQ